MFKNRHMKMKYHNRSSFQLVCIKGKKSQINYFCQSIYIPVFVENYFKLTSCVYDTAAFIYMFFHFCCQIRKGFSNLITAHSYDD